MMFIGTAIVFLHPIADDSDLKKGSVNRWRRHTEAELRNPLARPGMFARHV